MDNLATVTQPGLDVVNEAFTGFKDALVKAEFTIENPGLEDFRARIIYANRQNSIMSVVVTIAVAPVNQNRPYENYGINIYKMPGTGGWRMQATKCLLGPVDQLPDMLSEAKELALKYANARVQVILDKDIVDAQERRVDEHGFPHLKRGESLDEFWKETRYLAGVVVNAKGRYQPYYCYFTYKGEAALSYETRDYKTVKGAEKFLASHGYSLYGEVLDCVDGTEFAEGVRERFRPHYRLSWNDEILFECPIADGELSISALQKSNDPDRGTHYHIACSYHVAGQIKEEKTYVVNHPLDTAINGAVRDLYEFIALVRK